MLKHYKIRNYHFPLIIYLVILSVIGILLIGSAEASVQTKQVLGLFLGLLMMVVISLMDYSFILKFSLLYYVGIVFLLILVEIFGIPAAIVSRIVIGNPSL